MMDMMRSVGVFVVCVTIVAVIMLIGVPIGEHWVDITIAYWDDAQTSPADALLNDGTLQ